MNIAMVSIAYNGYQRFIPQWLDAVEKMTIKPKQLVIAVEETDDPETNKIYEDATSRGVQIVRVSEARNMGQMRNAAVSKTTTEWVMYLSVDDVIEPYSIEEFQKYEKDADWICIRWTTKGLGVPTMEHDGVTPLENFINRQKGGRGGFIIAQSPYRRRIWEKCNYEDHDLPNAPFIAAAVTNGARFVKTERPCTIYLRRPDSHARTSLLKIKSEAYRLKRVMELRIDRYYQLRVRIEQ